MQTVVAESVKPNTIHEYDEEGRVEPRIQHIVQQAAFVPCLSYGICRVRAD